MAFQKYGSLKDQGSPILVKVILANSIAAVVMDSVKSTGFVALGTTGDLVLGHIDSIVSKEGNGLLTTGVAGSEIGSYAGAFTAASDNQTVAQVAALVDISKDTLYSGTPDVAIGTTTGSNLLGYHTDIAGEDSIDESTAALTSAQYTIHGVSQANSARGVYSIYESQIFGV